MEYESSATILVSPDRLYQTIADVGNLSRLVPPITSVRRADDGHLDVEASYDGHKQHGEAWFSTDDAARKVEWGAEGHPYHGWMQVEADGDGSKLTFHLTTEHATEIQNYVDSTFESIRTMV